MPIHKACAAILLHQTATHCNTLQHTATHCNSLQHTYRQAKCSTKSCAKMPIYKACATIILHHTVTHCNTIQHIATHCSTHTGKQSVAQSLVRKCRFIKPAPLSTGCRLTYIHIKTHILRPLSPPSPSYPAPLRSC